MIYVEMKQVTVIMNGSMNRWIKLFVQKQIP